MTTRAVFELRALAHYASLLREAIRLRRRRDSSDLGAVLERIERRRDALRARGAV